MKKLLKKTLTLILCLALLASLPAFAFGETANEDEPLPQEPKTLSLEEVLEEAITGYYQDSEKSYLPSVLYQKFFLYRKYQCLPP